MRSTIILLSALLSIQVLTVRAALPTTAGMTPEDAGRPVDMTDDTTDDLTDDSTNDSSSHSQQPSFPPPLQPKSLDNTFGTRGAFESKFEVDSIVLGKGTFGIVYAATDKETHEKVAVKVISVPDKGRAQIIEEVCSLKMLARQPHILRFHSAYEDIIESKCWLVTELIEGCSLDRFSKLGRGSSKINPTFIPAIARQLVQALTYIHNEGLIHNDVKPANVMLSKSSGVKLIDFGLCRLYYPNDKCTHGTPFYISPEKFIEIVSSAADVWALGVTIFSLYSNPYSSNARRLTRDQFKAQLVRYGCPWPANVTGRDPWEGIPKDAREFFDGCLGMESWERATMDDLGELDFIEDSCTDEELAAYIQHL